MKEKSLQKLMIIIIAELLLIAGIVWMFDPFYQYHAPFWGLEAVLNDRDNQVVGTIDSFEYDSVLLGSSVSENFDSTYLDKCYDCQTLKIIRASGSIADLRYYLDRAHKKEKIKNVFWCLDIFALNSPTQVTLYNDTVPRYLHTDIILDDIPYVWNKEILFEKIPYMLAAAKLRKNTGGDAYSWSEGKIFGPEKAMLAYQRPETKLTPQSFENRKPLIAENMDLLIEEIEGHPDIDYRFILPPYSMLWWDCADRNGVLEENFYILEQVLPILLSYENVEVYDYQNQKEVICNLDNYMDMIHYRASVNQSMLEMMQRGEGRVEEYNWKDTISQKRELVEQITTEEIYRYYE